VAGDPIQIGQAPLKKQYRERLGLGIALAHADLLLRQASIARDDTREFQPEPRSPPKSLLKRPVMSRSYRSRAMVPCNRSRMTPRHNQARCSSTLTRPIKLLFRT
jgi:hypothetical protein